tara:strand:- start:1127 stop:1885 length:759 start_codon:yes stop_codon:yes gene_type:complete
MSLKYGLKKILYIIKIFFKIILFIASVSIYYLCIPIYYIKLNTISNILLENAARLCLKALGVKVILRTDRQLNNGNRKEIHIANHESSLDVLITQGYFCMPCLTTSHKHLSKILLGIEFVIKEYGHIPFDYKNYQSRIQSLNKIINKLNFAQKIFYYPSGSLITKITERFSKSVCFLSKKYNADIICWYFKYNYCDNKEIENHYRPIKFIFSRIIGKDIIVECTEQFIFKPEEYSNINIMREEIKGFYNRFI